MVVAANIVGFLYLFLQIGLKLSDPPITTRLTTSLEKSIALPAFTLCNLNVFNKTAIATDPGLGAAAQLVLNGLLTYYGHSGNNLQ